jgi:hypothetical protein
MSTDLDDLLRRDDEEEGPAAIGPAIQPGRSLADQLTMMSTPDPDQVPGPPVPGDEDQTDLIEHIAEKEAANGT